MWKYDLGLYLCWIVDQKEVAVLLAPKWSFLLCSSREKDKQWHLRDVYTAPFFIFHIVNRENLFICYRGCFTTVNFLQKHPQASSAVRDKLLLLSLIDVSQKRRQILLLCGTISPVISSTRSKQITDASAHLPLIPDDIILGHMHSLVHNRSSQTARWVAVGWALAQMPPSHAVPAVGSCWEPCNRSTWLAFWIPAPMYSEPNYFSA